MALSLKRRFAILKRDKFRCRYCGAAASDGVELYVDHVQPVSLGGEDADRNLVTACFDCNAGKSNIPQDWTPCSLADAASGLPHPRSLFLAPPILSAVLERIRTVIEPAAGKPWSAFTDEERNSLREEFERSHAHLFELYGGYGGLGVAECAPSDA